MTFGHGEAVAIALDQSAGAALIGERGHVVALPPDRAMSTIADIEHDIGPRWVWWSKATAAAFVASDIRPTLCWDLDTTHRLLNGGWRAGPGRVWALRCGLDPADLPATPTVDLFSVADDAQSDEAIRPDGHLSPAWTEGAWRTDRAHLLRWAELALDVYRWQVDALRALDARPAAPATARSESAAELLCAELECDGLPIDVAEAERVIDSFIGPRARDVADERARVDERDQLVLMHLGGVSAEGIDLRNPGSVKSLLRRVGIEVDDTRAWRLERRRDEHPIVDALLQWRRAERIATTFGYRWLDEHVGDDHRLRGIWSSSDGAAGRMTATAGLHNLPAEFRGAIVAEPGHVFVRSDLGQIEPRILAAVSADPALAAATREHDMYATVAAQLGVTREVAKVAVLGAMYGQTTGHGATALRGLEATYPVAMGFLTDAARRAEGGHDLRTRGGRLVRMSAGDDGATVDGVARSRAAARGRYGRNAMVQGAAAEFFKTWAVLVRARTRAATDATIVMCLHDELLVHASQSTGEQVRSIVDDALQEAAFRWARTAADVRFVADTTIIRRWSDAK